MAKPSNVMNNRLAQATFGILVQLASKKELRDQMVDGLKEAIFWARVPPTIMQSVVVPDRPVSATKFQKISLKEVFNFFVKNHGGEDFMPEKELEGHKTLIEHPNDGQLVQVQKTNAQNVLTHISRQLVKEIRRAEVAEKYFTKARRNFEEKVVRPGSKLTTKKDQKMHIAKCTKAFKVLALESESLNTKMDGISMAHLFYNRNRNEVLRSGYSPAPFDNMLAKIAVPNDTEPFVCPAMHDEAKEEVRQDDVPTMKV